MNNPNVNPRLAQYWLRMTTLAETHGSAVQYVMSDDTFNIPSMFYTVGMCQHEMPDLIVFGLGGLPQQSAPIVNTIVSRALKGDLKLIDGQIIHEAANLPLRLRAINPEKGFVFAAGARRFATEKGHEASLIQILLPDVQGRFPGDESCDPRIAQMQDIDLLLVKEQARQLQAPD